MNTAVRRHSATHSSGRQHDSTDYSEMIQGPLNALIKSNTMKKQPNELNVEVIQNSKMSSPTTESMESPKRSGPNAKKRKRN